MRILLLTITIMMVSCLADPIDEVGSIQQSLEWSDLGYLTDPSEELDCEVIDDIYLETVQKKGAQQLVQCNAPDNDVELFPAHNPTCQGSAVATAETGYHVENLVLDPTGENVVIIKTHSGMVYACACNYLLCAP